MAGVAVKEVYLLSVLCTCTLYCTLMHYCIVHLCTRCTVHLYMNCTVHLCMMCTVHLYMRCAAHLYTRCCSVHLYTRFCTVNLYTMCTVHLYMRCCTVTCCALNAQSTDNIPTSWTLEARPHFFPEYPSIIWLSSWGSDSSHGANSLGKSVPLPWALSAGSVCQDRTT